MKTTERFSNRVADYVRYRPHYPQGIITFLQEEIGLTEKWKIADIGSGTGISAEWFLKNGNTVYGVEPNKEMREAAGNIFAAEKNFISINATAETTGLPDNSVDLIIAGQAFHWFNAKETQTEFMRIASKHCYLVLMWNERKSDSPFQQAYEKMLFQFIPNYGDVTHRNTELKDMEAFFSPAICKVKSLPNAQLLDFESLKGRLLSSSYAPVAGHPDHLPMMKRLKEIFEQYSIKGQILFEYDCKLYYGQLK